MGVNIDLTMNTLKCKVVVVKRVVRRQLIDSIAGKSLQTEED